MSRVIFALSSLQDTHGVVHLGDDGQLLGLATAEALVGMGYQALEGGHINLVRLGGRYLNVVLRQRLLLRGRTQYCG